MRHPITIAVLAAQLLLVTACGPDAAVDAAAPDETRAGAASAARDRPETVEVGSWNVEWLGAPDRGPDDDDAQLDHVAHALALLDLDVVGLVEVVAPDAFAELVARLPGYHGVLATDDLVDGGSDAYGRDEQKVALVVRDRFTIERARVVLADHAWDFAGRPPLEVSLSFEERGRRRTIDVVVVHLKAMADADGYRRRQRAAEALQAWLAEEHARDWALVIGDFNDDLDASTYQGRTSPFDALARDLCCRFTTDALSAARTSTTIWHGATIDHHLATSSLARRFVEGSAEVLRPDAWVEDYGESTSDHYPVLTRYDLR